MAVNHATFDTVGIKEDVEDLVGIISPYDTPCYSSFRKTKAIQTLHSWQEDALAAPAVNKSVEGADTTIQDSTTTTLSSNYTQIFEKSAQVTGTVQSVELYGRASEKDYQIMKRGREMKRDIEHALVGLEQAGTAGSAGVAREMKSVIPLIAAANHDDNAGAGRPFTEALFLSTLQTVYEAGGDPETVLVTPTHSLTVANFAAASGRQRNFDEGTAIVNVVDLYVSPFGEVEIVLDRWLKADTALFMDMDKWSMPQLRPMTATPLAKTGDSDKYLINCELTLANEHSEASGCISDLN